MRKNVDVIIPIYNAYDDLAICLESIYKCTDLTRDRLVLINDNSPDERIRGFLDSQKKNNVIVIHNETNRGFSNNINIGMLQSQEHDVILLNSDTVVTSGWVDKMAACAYREASIGTVTPLSNNATLCSVPEFCEENRLPEGISVETAGEIVEKCSLHKYPRITVAHGFCMYVKREVIDRIGYFDAETFERGYGEENDFCNRAQLMGYHHVMCDDTYIYHSGTKSFISKEKEQYILQHDRILRERYPELMRQNDIHCRDNPNYFVGENVGIYFDLHNGRKNILYVVQSDFRADAEDNLGGTQLHVRDLMQGMRNQYNVFVAARNGQYLNFTVYYGEKERTFKYFIGERSNYYEFQNKEFQSLWRNLLSAFRIDLVHVHHVISLSFDIFYVAKELQIPVVFTAHDFYFICPSVKMLDADFQLCIGKAKAEDCKRCLRGEMHISDQIDYMPLWREKCLDVLQGCQDIYVPDKSARDVWSFYYPQLAEQIKVIEHGYDMPSEIEPELSCSNDIIYAFEKIEKEGATYKVTGWAYHREKENGNTYLKIANKSGMERIVPTEKVNRLDVETGNMDTKVGFTCVIPMQLLDGGELDVRVLIEYGGQMIYAMESYITPSMRASRKKKLNVAFIGGINKAKGGDEISGIIESMPDDVNWFVFGGIGTPTLQYLKKDNLVKTGYYLPQDLSKLLEQHEIDVIAILSIWPETYSYTLTEAILNKIPAIVTDIGALGKRAKELECGWCVDTNDIKRQFKEIIMQLIQDPKQLSEWKAKVGLIKLPDIREMADQYKREYQALWNEDIAYADADYEFIFRGYDSNHQNAGEPCTTNRELEDKIRALKSELQLIESSAGYRIMNKMWKTNFPGRNALRKLVLKVVRK